MRHTLLLLTLTVSLIACQMPNKQTKKESDTSRNDQQVQVDAFDKVVFNGIGRVHVALGDKTELKMKGDQSLFGEVSKSVSDGTLTIEAHTVTGVDYYITTKSITSLVVMGAGEIVTDEPLKVEDLTVRIAGAGKANLNLNGDQLDARIDGAGKIEAQGSVKRVQVHINGAGRYDGDELKSESAWVSINGVGKASVDATEKLDVEIIGGGKVIYKGDPQVTRSISGLGTVEKES